MLSYIHRFLLPVSLLLSAALCCLADTPAAKPTPKQIAQWVEQLGDNNYTVRESASKKLWQAGAAAESALEQALKSNDLEVVRRARDLLAKFQWGIYPDTPADIVALIRTYQTGKANTRKEVLQKLLKSGTAGRRVVLKIARAEKDDDQRRTILRDLIVSKLPAAFLLAVTEAKYERYEQLLELGHESQFVGQTQYAAYWLLRGKLADRIAHFRTHLREHPDDKWSAETLFYLYRANGDLGEARKAAEKSEDAELIDGILYEQGDWKALTARAKGAAKEKPSDKGVYHITEKRIPAEKWAYRAAYARLAGKQKDFENAVVELRQCAEGKKDREQRAFVTAKGLLLNDRPAEALNILRTLPERREVLFDLLSARLDFAAALDLVKKEPPTDKLISDLKLAHARLLCLLGEKEGEALFDRYAERIKDRIDPMWVQKLLKEEMRAGLKDRAFAHAAKALSVAPPNVVDPGKEARERFYLVSYPQHLPLYFGQLFPQQTMTATLWWAVLRREFKDESPAAVLKRLRDLLEGKVAAKDVSKWIERAEKGKWLIGDGLSNSIPSEPVQSKRRYLAEVATLVGLDDLARSLLKKEQSRDAFLRLGDRLAAKKQWGKAAERYRQAWDKELQTSPDRGTHDPLPLYLAGDALVHTGQEKEGKKLIEQSHWIPWADAEARFDFFRALVQRGHREAAQRETDLMLRASEPNSYYSGEALRHRAIAALKRKEYLHTAEGFEQSMLRCLHPYTNFVSNASYVQVPAQIHQLRAKSLLAAGKLDEALKHADLTLTVSPGYVNLPIELVPELERHGHKKEAMDLFNRCYHAYAKVCRAYPRCAWAHNSAAWMSACCRRNLDKGLEHAEKAIELAPSNAGYLDTLAEIHFQRGDKNKAVALQKRAIELDPKKSYYRKQLKRLESGDPSTERPPEDDE